MNSIVRRETGEDWQGYVTRLMREEGVVAADDYPTDEQFRRFDKPRKGKKVSNEEWVSPSDSEAKIPRMKDGTTHLAYKAEHVVDLKTDVIVAAEILPVTDGHAQTLADSVMKAQENLSAIGREQRIEEVVGPSWLSGKITQINGLLGPGSRSTARPHQSRRQQHLSPEELD